MDGVDKGWLGLFLDAQIRLGGETHLKSAIDAGFRDAVGDLFRPLVGRRKKPAAPAQPIGPAGLAGNAPTDLRAVDRRSGVRLRLAGEDHEFPKLGRFFRRFKGDLEFGTLVFLHRDGGGPVNAFLDRHASGDASFGRGESSAEAAAFVGRHLDGFNLFAVHVAKADREGFVRQGVVVVFLRVGVGMDALEADRLAGTVDRTICEEVGLDGIEFTLTLPEVHLGARDGGLAVFHEEKGGAVLRLLLEETHRIGLLVDGLALPVSVIVGIPNLDGRSGDRFAAQGIEDKSLGSFGRLTRDEGERRDPEGRGRDLIVFGREIGRGAGEERIKARLLIGRSGDHYLALAVVRGLFEGARPSRDRSGFHEGLKSFVIEILGRLPLFFGEGPLARDEAEVDGFDVAVGELDLRTRGVPHLFGSDPEFARFDAVHEIAAGNGKHGIGMTLRCGRSEATGLGEFFGHHEPLRERGSHGDAGLLGGMRFEQGGQLLAGAGVGLVSGRFAGGPFDAVEIDEGPRRSVGVVRVKTQEVLVKRDRTQLRRGGVGRLRFPGEEFRHRAEGG